MIIFPRGRRIEQRALANLAAALTVQPLAQHLTEDGFALAPVRAPHGLTNGELIYRLTWRKREENATITVRTTVRLHAPQTA